MIKTVADNRIYDEIFAKKFILVDNDNNELLTINKKEEIPGQVMGGINLYKYEKETNKKHDMSGYISPDYLYFNNFNVNAYRGNIVLYKKLTNSNKHFKMIIGENNIIPPFYGLGMYSVEGELTKDELRDFYVGVLGNKETLDMSIGTNILNKRFPLISLRNDDGNDLISISPNKSGQGGIWLYNKEGHSSKYFGY